MHYCSKQQWLFWLRDITVLAWMISPLKWRKFRSRTGVLRLDVPLNILSCCSTRAASCMFVPRENRRFSK